MAKYSYEFKKEVVQAYLDGKGGYKFLAKEFGIPSPSKVKLWVDNYRTFNVVNLRKYRKFNKKHLTIGKKMQPRYRY